MHVGVITNPHSRKNKVRRERVQRLQAILGGFGEVHETESTAAIRPVLREFLRKGTKYWVSDGGDGALHWMLREGFAALGESEFVRQGMRLPLALPTNGGSIDFVAHNVGIQGDAESLLAALTHALEYGEPIAEAEVDTMLVDGIEVTAEGDRPLQTIGFASAVGGVGQRFFGKLFEAGDHTPPTIMAIVAKTLASYPIAMSPLKHVPGMPEVLRDYAEQMFRPTQARIVIDGRELPERAFTGVHVASMSIDLGGVFKFFHAADTPGTLHAIVGCPTPLQIIGNLSRMHAGQPMQGDGMIDGPCAEMTVEATSDELLAPVIDGEYYPNLRRVTFRLGPKVRIPRLKGRPLTVN